MAPGLRGGLDLPLLRAGPAMSLTSGDGQVPAGQLPRFLRAGESVRFLSRLAIALGSIAAALLVAALLTGFLAPDSLWRPVLCFSAASLLLLVCSIRSAEVVARWRWRATAEAGDEDRHPRDPQPADGEAAPAAGRSTVVTAIARVTRAAAVAVGLGPMEVAALSLLALLTVTGGWSLALPVAAAGLAESLLGGFLLAAAFGLLVLERHFAHVTPAEWPEAPRLAQLARVPILTMLVSAFCLFASEAGGLWPYRLIMVAAVVPAAVAVEFLVRALLAVFRPAGPEREPTLVADSVVADLLEWPPPSPLAALQEGLRSRTGIDLRQVWAFSFIGRALVPIACGMALLGWLLTGVREIPLDGRAIYEQFGKPQAVLGPGLHAGLPWPLGRFVPVENGIVHELAAATPPGTATDEPAAAEGPAPASANRLWDISHPMEKAQLVASREKSGESFQIVDMDIRFVYRIGLSDTAAMDATYNTADLPALIRSTAGRVLVHEFASRTLEGVLGEKRTALADEIGAMLRSELDRVNSGVEILAVVIEAIHPPSGVANAYHGVQAAEINVQAAIARERANAEVQTNEAQINANALQDGATAGSSENLAQAQVVQVNANAEARAYATAGSVFLQEQYLEHLKRALQQAELLLVDHRIAGGGAPTIDLRDFMAPTSAPAASPEPEQEQGASDEDSNDTSGDQ